jgi:hypothetical protein
MIRAASAARIIQDLFVVIEVAGELPVGKPCLHPCGCITVTLADSD